MNTISWWRTSFGDEEIRLITESIADENISEGPVTARFEKMIGEILGVPYVVATTSGSMAMLMALMAAGVGPGDEVIVPNRTWIATAHAPLMLGAKVVLVDVEADRPIMDIAQVERSITSRTKAIIPVHLNGRSVAMDEINRIAVKYSLRVIEDAAQAFCSKNAHGMLGGQSFAGCFSLSVAKLISTGQGGFIVTKDRETYKRLNSMRTHGVSDVINATYTQMGFNFRFNDILASIGIAQLTRVFERIDRVKAIYAKYEEAMHEIPYLRFIPVNIEAGEIPIYIEVLCNKRERLVKFLASKGVQTRPFYPDLDSADYMDNIGRFPHSKVFGEKGLFLPSGPAQSIENVDFTIDVLTSYKS